MTELSRFDELRIKTDEQLVQLMNNELDRGIRDARQVLVLSQPAGVLGVLYVRAQKAYAEVSRLILLPTEIGQDERGGVERRLEELRRMLERASEQQTESNDFCLAN